MSVITGEELAWWKQLKKVERIISLELKSLERHLCDEVAAGAIIAAEDPELASMISKFLNGCPAFKRERGLV